MSDVVLYDLHPSPNNIKVRLALGYKHVEYELVAVDPMDRGAVIGVSGQPLCPVLRHGDTVVFDSSAILRYLEANVARHPRLFSEDRETMREIEGWEARTRGGGFGAPVGICFEQYFAEEKDPARLAEARELFGERCREIEGALGEEGFLVGGELTAADVCVVPLLAFGAPSEAFLVGGGLEISRFIAGELHVPDDCPRTRAYVEGVMRYDRSSH